MRGDSIMFKSRGNNVLFWIVFFVFLVATASILLASLTSIVKTYLQTSRYEATQGRVVLHFIGLESDGTDVGGRPNWVKYRLPIIEYKVDGKTYQIEYEEGRRQHIRVGTLVDVSYNPTLPENAIISSKLFRNDHLGVFFGLCAMTFLLLLYSFESEAELFVHLRFHLLCLAGGALSLYIYLFIGSQIGTLNPFIIPLYEPMTIILLIFLGIGGNGMYFSVKNIIAARKSDKKMDIYKKIIMAREIQHGGQSASRNAPSGSDLPITHEVISGVFVHYKSISGQTPQFITGVQYITLIAGIVLFIFSFTSNMTRINFSSFFMSLSMIAIALFGLSIGREVIHVQSKILIPILCFGILGVSTYVVIGSKLGSFNPITMILSKPISIAPCVFLIVAGLMIFFPVKKKAP